MKKTGNLWTKDFSCITIATVLSAIGGEAMNLPVSLLVFDETKSTFLAAIIMVCGMLPDIILPIFIAPFIDKGKKKSWIVGLDLISALLYAGMGGWIYFHSFQYVLYVVFTLVIGTVSVFYRLAYGAWYPDLIPVGCEQKGYAVSSTIYPVVVIIMSPVATFLYALVPMGILFGAVAGISIISVIVEMMVQKDVQNSLQKYTIKQYFEDIREGFLYVKKEKGIRNIYTYMSITSGASQGVGVITQAYYQTQPWLTVTMLGFLRSAEMIGRVLSGLFQYVREIPVKKRYSFTKKVYLIYDIMDGILLFLPYPLMLANRFLCGGLGTSSATIRETAVQSYLPAAIRARVNGLFQVIFAIGGVFFQMLAGLLGQVLPYTMAALLLGMVTLISMIVFIVIPKNQNRPIYEAVRFNPEEEKIDVDKMENCIYDS